jgi:hypothetical protein
MLVVDSLTVDWQRAVVNVRAAVAEKFASGGSHGFDRHLNR